MSERADVAVRPLQPEDLDAYKSLRDATLASHPTAFTSDAEAENARPAHHYLGRLGLDRGDGGQFTLGAFELPPDTLVGALSCERDMRAKVRHIGRVAGMMVRDDRQQLGIGRRLLEACIARARSHGGLELLTLSVTSTNQPALHLYAALGFVRYGQLERAIKVDGRYHAKDLMVLAL